MVLIFYVAGLIFSLGFLVSWYECLFLMMVGVSLSLVSNYSSLSVWGLSGLLGLDGLSWSLICLSLWIGGLMLISSPKSAGGG